MQDLNWSKLPFGYVKTHYNVRSVYKDGKWSDIEVSDSEYVNIHMAATVLHYGQEAFEGMKAYRGKDNQIRLFRWDENAKRLQNSANGIFMAPVDSELFFEMVKKVAPRCLGKREPWMLMHPRRGSSRMEAGNMRP